VQKSTRPIARNFSRLRLISLTPTGTESPNKGRGGFLAEGGGGYTNRDQRRLTALSEKQFVCAFPLTVTSRITWERDDCSGLGGMRGNCFLFFVGFVIQRRLRFHCSSNSVVHHAPNGNLDLGSRLTVNRSETERKLKN